MFLEQIGFCVCVGAYLALCILTTVHAARQSARSTSNNTAQSTASASSPSTHKVASSSVCSTETGKAAAMLADAPSLRHASTQMSCVEYARLAVNYSASFNSAFLVVGSLSEAYLYGVRMVGNIISVFLGFVYALLIVQPFMCSLDAAVTSPYVYFAKRYRDSRCVRAVSASGGLLFYFLFLTLFLWGGTVLMSTVIPYIPLYASSILIGCVSLAGGLMSVNGFVQSTRVNVVQFLILLVGLVATIVLSIVKNRHDMSVAQMVEVASENNRTVFFDTTVDLNTRYTILNQVTSLSLVSKF
jgi:hypothetical protein